MERVEELTKERDPVIIVITSCMNPPDKIFSESREPTRMELTEIRLNLRTKESNRKVIVTGINLEAGQVTRSFLGRKTRGLAKVDLEDGIVSEFNYRLGRFGGELTSYRRKKEKTKGM
ncbi:unnamed protein product [Arabis nemorensis]|uniref:Uncharacterized protein n=1 Tax=Arabis nemorensis TaxID=586526 RepID=A0A565BA53_9BRAS|nr:unnamed protein product [Arabis nemorensis]